MKKKRYTRKELREFARQTENKEILMRKDDTGYSVAHWLAWKSDKTKWYTDDKEILMLQDSDGRSVAHILADNHPTWNTNIPEILILYSSMWKETVEDVLVKKGKI